jgi:DNA-binding NarL/FixJ family response regulator
MGGHRVLAIEDDELLLARWRRACNEARLTLDFVSTVHAARAIFERWPTAPYDYVLLDLKLPDGSGSSLLTDILALEPSPMLAVVSAYLDAEVMLALQTRAVWMLAKPVTPAQLLSLLARMQRRDALELRARDTPGVWRFTEAHQLSSCETEAFLQLVEGYSREQVARRMGCRLSTVHTYVKRIRDKTGQKTFRGVLAALVQYLELSGHEGAASVKNPPALERPRGTGPELQK